MATYSTIIIPFYVLPGKDEGQYDYLKKLLCKDGDESDWIIKDDLFDGGIGDSEENKRAEYEYFFEEVTKALYSSDNDTMQIFFKNTMLEIVCGDYRIMSKKIYFHLTYTGTGALIIELEESDRSLEDLFKDFDKADAEEIIEKCFQENYKNHKDNIHLPYLKKVFATAYKTVEEVKEKTSPKQPTIHQTYMQKVGGEEGLQDYFSHYFIIFLIVVIQRTELLRVSSMAADIAAPGKSNRIIDVFGDYTRFKNHFDFIECTPDYDGQTFYQTVRTYYDMNNKSEQLENQIQALSMQESVDSDRRMNKLLAALSSLVIVSALVDGTDYILNYLFNIIDIQHPIKMVISLIVPIAIVSIIIFIGFTGKRKKK